VINNIVTIETVKKSFADVSVLRGIDLIVKSGERVGLMGPSGSGKSTLLNCICGIETVDEGTICMDAENLGKLTSRELERLRREKVGYIFQSFHLLPTLNAFENVEFSAQLANISQKERKERVNELLRLVGMEHRANHLPDSLSGGERQRVAIARALIHNPKLVLADEPTGSLDTETGSQVLDLLESLSDEFNVSLLLVTHDKASTRICDRVITMQDGLLIS
jgi:putative ABC transport system ATP-binding protein